MSHLFKVIFLNQDQVYEVYARGVTQGGLLGFVEIDDLVFGERAFGADSTEERLEDEFEGVKRFYLPMHNVLRIDEVEKRGPSRIREVRKGGTAATAKVTPFPVPTDTGPKRL